MCHGFEEAALPSVLRGTRCFRRKTGSRRSSGLTLVEILIVIVLMAIIAATVIPSADTAVDQQLQLAARVLTTDLAYARSLAITHDSTYRITFDLENDRYILEHTGSDNSLDTLPESLYRNPDDPPTKHIVRLKELPHCGAPVELAEVTHVGVPLEPATNIEFDYLGKTTDPRNTLILLTAGEGDQKRHLFVMVHAVTGNSSIGRHGNDLSADLTSSEYNAIDAEPGNYGVSGY